VPGELDAALRPTARHVGRTDRYHLESLGPTSSLKRRGRHGPLEWKTRVGPVERCEISGVPGLAERWTKQRVRQRDLERRPLGAWIEVDKQLWRLGDVEIGRLGVGGERWWTIAVPVRPEGTSKSSAKVIASCRELLLDVGEPVSYPMWVLARGCEQSEQLSSSEVAPADRCLVTGPDAPVRSATLSPAPASDRRSTLATRRA